MVSVRRGPSRFGVIPIPHQTTAGGVVRQPAYAPARAPGGPPGRLASDGHRAFFGAATPFAVVEGSDPDPGSGPINRRRAALAVSPFLALGFGDVILLLVGGIDPLWGFMILPPILFLSTLGWIAFRTGLDRDGTD